MPDATGFIPRHFSLSPIDLIDPELDEDLPTEADARAVRYAQLGRQVDLDDVAELVLSRLKDSTAFLAFLEDLRDYPIDPDRPRVHPMEALRLAEAIAVIGDTAWDECTSVLDVVED